MKTKTILTVLSLLIFLPTFNSFAQKVDFSGEWKLDREKTVLADNQLFLSGITIQMKADSLLSTRVYENGMGEEYPFEENLSLDGKDCKIVIFEMPRTSKATLSDTDGSITIASTTTVNGNNGEEEFASKEVWKVDTTGQILTLEFTNTMSGNETTGTNYYKKAK